MRTATAKSGGGRFERSARRAAFALAGGFFAAIVLLGGGEEWRRVEGPRVWKFPADHGAHSAFRIEWWYFTGNLADPLGHKYGYELTFFRQGVRIDPADPGNPWSIRDLYLAHFAVTDAGLGVFRKASLLSRSGPGLAGARPDALDVWCLDWSAKMTGNVIHLNARRDGLSITLRLEPRKPVVLHGVNGLSRKGAGEGEASFYASITDLETAGTITPATGRAPVVVTGTSWFDHEFSSDMLAKDKAGWDWFSFHLSDGRDLMVYFMRRADGTADDASAGTLVEPNGEARPLARSDIRMTILDRWRSPSSGGNYPGRWRLEIPAAGIDLVIAPLLADQELVAAGLPDLVYWEGAVAADGSSRGRPVRAEGYVELTGYAGDLKAIFDRK